MLLIHKRKSYNNIIEIIWFDGERDIFCSKQVYIKTSSLSYSVKARQNKKFAYLSKGWHQKFAEIRYP